MDPGWKSRQYEATSACSNTGYNSPAHCSPACRGRRYASSGSHQRLLRQHGRSGLPVHHDHWDIQRHLPANKPRQQPNVILPGQPHCPVISQVHFQGHRKSTACSSDKTNFPAAGSQTPPGKIHTKERFVTKSILCSSKAWVYNTTRNFSEIFLHDLTINKEDSPDSNQRFCSKAIPSYPT
jgi:hypothetical protein